jgi:hypothetical protein
MQKTDEETTKIVEDLINCLDSHKLNPNELVHVISTLLFSVGVSLEGCGNISAEKVLTNFATKPTLGSALMAQALYMKETWTKVERKEKDDRTERDIQGQTEEN